MFYIHQSTCISHQPTFNEVDIEHLNPSENNQLPAIEPKYEGISPGHLRRMGKAVRMGVGSALPLLMQNKLDGILIGTANGGIEDSLIFLKQIMDYEEGRLTPTNFVQSTFNAIAGQLGMITKNTGYNVTHVHRGLAFENVMLDAVMFLRQYKDNSYLIGGVDEISVRNYRMESMAAWYKKEELSNSQLYDAHTVGSLPGEGAAMFVVNNVSDGAAVHLRSLKMLNTDNETSVQEQFNVFLKDNGIEKSSIDLFLSGEDGDSRFLKYYTACESAIDNSTNIARYKHMTGEFQTASALALWLACHIIKTQSLPAHMVKRKGTASNVKHVMIYNNYRGIQHSLMLLEKV